MSETVNDLSGLLQKHLNHNEVITNVSYTRLTAPGENFGSIMLKVDLTIMNKEKNEERSWNLVAKILPETEEFRKLFKIQTTYTNEMAFYDIIIPTLRKFQVENGVEPIDSFPKCYATRKNLLENSEIINDDAVLLLENLSTLGYVNADKRLGFDLETTKLLLKDLAVFHASFLALKLQKPEVFNKYVRAYCQNFEVDDKNQFEVLCKNILVEAVKDDEECLKLVPKVKFGETLERSEPREPYATLVHSDLWVNNSMQLFKDGKPISNKFVDFQIFTYGSPASDVFFLLWSSVQKEALETNLDSLLALYHDNFVSTLRRFKCDPSTFTFDEFLKELVFVAEYEFHHSITFFITLSAIKDKIEDVTAEGIKNAPGCREKLIFMLRECNKRGWLY